MDFESVEATSVNLAEPTLLSTHEMIPGVIPDVAVETTEAFASSLPTTIPPSTPKFAKGAIRTSLKASTWDGMLATLFSNITGGVLLTNFLMDLKATPAEIGLLASIPMLANLAQPLGAYLSEQTSSRHTYCLWIYGISRSLWLILAIGIFMLTQDQTQPHALVIWTIAIALLSYGIGALGSAPWLSWMAALVPRRLRGRYFGFRNSAANLTNLISIPLTGLFVSKWVGGSLQGYGLVLIFGILAGLASLWFQNFMADINPKAQHAHSAIPLLDVETVHSSVTPSWLATFLQLMQTPNLLLFLVYFSIWMFAVNLSAPFFNLYLLDNLQLDVSQVSLYNSLAAGANLLLLVVWGRLADRIGNRPILLCVGILVAITPLLWLVTGANSMSIWLWLPFLHVLSGGTWAAIDLCSNNLQIGVAPAHYQSTYFGIVAAVAGICSALGTMAGGFLAQFWQMGGLLGLFALSSVLRLMALLPLVLIREPGVDDRIAMRPLMVQELAD